MAKDNKDNSKNRVERINAAQEELELLQEQLDVQKKILEKEQKRAEKKREANKLTEEEKKELEVLKKSYDEIAGKVKKQTIKVDKLKNSYDNFRKSIKKSVEDFEEIDGALGSIERILKDTSSNTLVAFEKQLKTSKVTIGSISEQLQTQNDLSENQVEVIKKATRGYGSSIAKIAQMNVALAKGTVDRVEYNESIIRSMNEFEKLKDAIDDTTESGKALKTQIQEAYEGMVRFKEAAERSQKAIQIAMFATDKLSSAIPQVGGDLQKVFESAIKGGKGMTIALAGLGAGLGALAYNLGSVDNMSFGDKIKTASEFQVQLNNLNTALDNTKLAIEGGLAPAGEKLAKGFERNFAAQRASLQFSFKSISDIAQFQSESKTALFGDKLGGVGYAKDQLQQAGISAGVIADQMKSTGDIMGKMPSSEVAADMAAFSKQMGIGGDLTAKVAKLFGATSNLSAKTAMNMQAAVASFAKNKGLSFSKIMENIASSSESVLTYTTKNVGQLQRNAIYAASIGVDQAKINELGENMVLNYKDSIKAEMQLSSLLGESVDLSEVRARFAAGDETGALEALKAQGLDPETMNAFQRQALMQALPGMSLSDLTNIATKTGVDTKGAVGVQDQQKMTQEFLTRTQEALQQLDIDNANISIKEKIRMNEFENELNNTIESAIQQDVYGIKGLMKEISQVEFLKEAANGLQMAAYMLMGAAGLSGLGQIGQFFKGKMPNIFGPKGPAAPPTTPPRGPTATPTQKPSAMPTQDAKGRWRDPVTGKYTKAPSVAPTTTTTPGSITQDASGRWRDASGKFTKAPTPTTPTVSTTPTTPTAPTTPTPPSSVSNVARNSKFATTLAKTGNVLSKATKVLGPVGAVVGAGLDYSARKDAGQTTTQAAVGAGAGAAGGFAGGVAGAKLGAVIGSFILPGVGTAVGGAIGGIAGGLAGYFLASKGADALTGAATTEAKKSPELDKANAQMSEAAKAQQQQLLNQQSATASALTASAVSSMGAINVASNTMKVASNTTKPIANAPLASKTPTMGSTVTGAAAGAALAGVATKTTDKVKQEQSIQTWIQDKMIYISGNLEKMIVRSDKLVAESRQIAGYAKTSSEKLIELNTNTKAILQLTRVMEQISVENYARETGNKNINLKVDGKTIAVAVDRFNANNKGGTSNAKRK